MTIIDRLQKKYGIRIVSEGHHFTTYGCRQVETFKVYSADGCCWDKGLTRKGLQEMCKADADALLGIKKNAEAARRKLNEINTDDFIIVPGATTDRHFIFIKKTGEPVGGGFGTRQEAVEWLMKHINIANGLIRTANQL